LKQKDEIKLAEHVAYAWVKEEIENYEMSPKVKKFWKLIGKEKLHN